MPLAGAQVKAYNGWEQDTVSTLETTTSTTFVDLATAGPTVTVYLDVGQSCLIVGEVAMFVSSAGVNGAVWAPQVDGPSTSDLTAADANGAETGHVTEWTPSSKHHLFTATAAGDHTIKLVYRVIGAFTASFKERRLTVMVSP